MAAPRDALARAPAEALREWGLSHPAMHFLVGVAPPLESAAADGAPRLVLDTARAPWVSVKGETRVSVARVFTVGNGRRILVAQVQVTERAPAGRPPERKLRLYVHDEGMPAQEFASGDAWWLAVLERHYARGGSPVDMADYDAVSA